MCSELMASSTHKDLGDQAVKDKDYNIALGHYNRAINEDEPTAALYSNRSLVHLKLQKYKKAELDAKNAIELRPDWGKPYARLCEAKRKLGDFQESMEAIIKACQLEPENKIFRNIYNSLMEKFTKKVEEQTRRETFQIFETTKTGIMNFEDFKQMRRMAKDMNPDNFVVDDFNKMLIEYESSNSKGFDYQSWNAYLEEHPEQLAHINTLTFMPSLIEHYDIIHMIEKYSKLGNQISETIASFANPVLFRFRLQDKPRRMEFALLASDHDPKILRQLKIARSATNMVPFFTAFIGVPDADPSMIIFAANWVDFESGFKRINHHLAYLENGNLSSIDEITYAKILVKVFEFFDISWRGCVKLEVSSKLKRLETQKIEEEMDKLIGRSISVERSMPAFGGAFFNGFMGDLFSLYITNNYED